MINKKTVGIVLIAWFALCKLKANQNMDSESSVGSIVVDSGQTIETMPAKPLPCVCLLRWLIPTTKPGLIYKYINITPGSTFQKDKLLRIKNRLEALPYFLTVSVTSHRTYSHNGIAVSDVMIQTKDRFPLVFDADLFDEQWFSLTHNNVAGYGHILDMQIFLNKRWGCGLQYELPFSHGNYLIGGHYYRRKEPKNLYKLDYWNIWTGKLFTVKIGEKGYPSYIRFVAGVDNKQFIKPLSVDKGNRSDKEYELLIDKLTLVKNYKLFLSKLAFVRDEYEKIRGIYGLRALETLPAGKSLEVLFGYQIYNNPKGPLANRPYIGVNAVWNISNPTVKFLHLRCEAGSFLYRKKLEEAVVKLVGEYGGPLLTPKVHGIRQFIQVKYITGYHMPKTRQLDMATRDPEELERPKENVGPIKDPIHTRINLNISTTLHAPLRVKSIDFALLGYSNFIALYNRNNSVLNKTYVNGYGAGLLAALNHALLKLPTVEIKIGYNPLLDKPMYSLGFSICPFKNVMPAKSMVISYN